jgi:hypothetical protein
VYILAITVVMKKAPSNIKPPKRSSSLVSRVTRPIIEQQSQRAISPTSSFSSSILTKGMSERITTSPPLPPQKSDDHPIKSNRRRIIDFSRRRTVAGTSEQNSNKENFSIKNQQKSPSDIYRFSPSSSNNKVEIHPPSKHTVTKKYYFHSNPSKTNEDLLNNSYGLTLLKQQQQQEQQQQPLQQRHSVAAVLMISQVPNNISSQNHRTSIQQHHTLDSLEDLLCDREVESYFYPASTPSQSEHVYMNLENSSDYFQSPSSYLHGTLC